LLTLHIIYEDNIFSYFTNRLPLRIKKWSTINYSYWLWFPISYHFFIKRGTLHLLLTIYHFTF